MDNGIKGHFDRLNDRVLLVPEPVEGTFET